MKFTGAAVVIKLHSCLMLGLSAVISCSYTENAGNRGPASQCVDQKSMLSSVGKLERKTSFEILGQMGGYY
jgi:hypothetical protein